MDSADDVYHVLEFDELGRYSRFMMQVLQFVGGREGIRYMAQEPHAVVWAGSGIRGIREGEHHLFLNPTALEAVREAGLDVEVVREIGQDELPENRSLIIGQQGDWNR